MRKLVGLVGFAVVVACAPPKPPPTLPVDPTTHVIVVACQMDSGQIYAEITTFQPGWYSVAYSDGQYTAWQEIRQQWYTLGSVHTGDFEVHYSTTPQPDDDPVVIPEGGIFHVFGQPNCAQSTEVR